MRDTIIYTVKSLLYSRVFFAALLLAVHSFKAKAQFGANDPAFNPGTGADGIVRTTAIQSDGKIMIGGDFNYYNGTARHYIARLNADGTLDATFNPGTGTNATVQTTTIQSDGKIIICGGFISYNGTSIKCIARLNANGTLDATFNPGTGANGTVYTTAIQSDGKIIIGGDFTSYNGTSVNRIARLNANGTLEATFNPGTGSGGGVNTIAIQSDGKIIIGGNFTSYNGTSINRIARLNANGTLDSTFNPGTGANFAVSTTAIQSDGKIMIGGNFTSINGTERKYIARLNADGTLDATFNPGTGANNNVMKTVIQSNGGIIIVGSFTSYNGTSINRIARLNTNGTRDATFNPGTGANDIVFTTAIQSDGKIIIGGVFTSYNGTGRNRIARILNCTVDVSLTVSDPVINANAGGASYQWVDCDNAFAIISGATSQTYTATSNGNYAVIVTQGLCSDTSVCTQINSVGMSSLQTLAVISIYPNPVSDKMAIEIKGSTEKTDFEILNSLGQIVFKGTLTEKTLVQTNSFSPGVYLIKFTNMLTSQAGGKTFEFRKIIKE